MSQANDRFESLQKKLPQGLLALAAAFYGIASRIRNALYDCGVLKIKRVNLPVVSVGNISAGGNAKTPLCLYLARLFRDLGRNPVILSRGYGGEARGPLEVSDADSARRVGDEPLLMFRAGERVVIARDRVAGARYIEEKHLGDIILLDDGLQHRRLHRDLNIIAVKMSSEQDAEEWRRGALLPLGFFREPLKPTLARAHTLIFVDRRSNVASHFSVPPDIAAGLPAQLAFFQASFSSSGVLQPGTKQVLPQQSVVAVCGIANPMGFLASLEQQGYPVTEKHIFPDHFPMSEATIAAIRAAIGPARPIVCTEKDLVRLKNIPAGLFVLPVELNIFRKEAFVDYLKLQHLQLFS
jgi:tetraacyldisaccharide 4'-kinase